MPDKPPPKEPPDLPRRGAIPTPKEVIEKATPFVPGRPPPKPETPKGA